jgi:transposase-like protein
MKTKKLYTAEEKAKIMRERIEDNISISDISEKYKIHLNVLYNWQRQLCEQAPQTLSRKNNKAEKQKSSDKKPIAELETLLSIREGLIAELVQENIEYKKKANGEILTRNGLNRKSGMK